LSELFHDKCAYCEGQYGGGGPPEIEHFRPKGKILVSNGEAPHFGYWWVAADWTNLLLSCVDCNRQRYHIVVSEGMTLLEAEKQKVKVKSGKKNAFPVRGIRRLPEQMDFEVEEPLLIDPTLVDPARHLRFVVVGEISLAVPHELNGAADVCGAASIQIYGLNRLGLVKQRAISLAYLRYFEDAIGRALHNVAVAPDDIARAQWLSEAMIAMDQLEKAAAPNSPFSAVAAEFLKAVEKKYGLRQP
jgi:hypothetical protein